MPRYIVKANRNEDFYVEWSTVVDAPVQWGPINEFRPAVPEARKMRADANGTSSLDGFYDWGQESFLVANMGDQDFYMLPRANLKDFLEALGSDPEDREVQQAALYRYAKKVDEE